MSTPTFHRAAAIGAAVMLGAVGLSACGANDADDGGDGDAGQTIALLLPETATTRYEEHDSPLFEAKVEELCADCEILYLNADQDEAKQAEQLDQRLGQGADVVVLDPVNCEAAAGMVDEAQGQDVPVIAYDRFIESADYYMSFDNATVGQIQAEALVEAMGGKGDILMLNGAPSDPNAAQFKEGAHSVLDASGVNDPRGVRQPRLEPRERPAVDHRPAQQVRPTAIQGVYAANDGQAGGVIAALTGAGVAADALPPMTGQDAEVAAIQRILVGEQAMTIYKSIKIEAETAAELAVTLADGEDAPTTTETGVEQSDFQGVPSYIFDPVVVTADNVNDTVIADGFYEASDICTGDYADACEAAGIS